MAGEMTKALSPAELAEVRRFGIHPELSSREMTDIEDARPDRVIALLRDSIRGEAYGTTIPVPVEDISALIAEHDDAVKEAEMRRSESADFERERDAAVKEMHARELHHFETEKAITEALAEADRVSSSRPHWAVLNRVVNILRDTLNGTSAPPTDDERPIHLPMGFNKHGRGPVAENSPEFDHWGCWCSDPECERWSE